MFSIYPLFIQKKICSYNDEILNFNKINLYQLLMINKICQSITMIQNDSSISQEFTIIPKILIQQQIIQI